MYDLRRTMVLCPLLWLGTLSTCAALEPRIAAPFPGLKSDPSGSVTTPSAAVNITAGRIVVTMTLNANDSAGLLLEGELFGPNENGTYPDRQFPELDIRVDGTPLMPEDRFEAFAGKTNVTNLIKLADMDPWAITRTPSVTSPRPANPQVLRGLVNVRAIEKFGDGYLAKWAARRIIRIPLNSASEQKLELSYAARPSVSLMSAQQLDTVSRERSYCASPKQLNRWTRSRTGSLAVEEFVIPSAIDDRPASTVIFGMAPDVERRPSYVFLCGPHGRAIFRKDAVTREEAEVDGTGILRVLRVIESDLPISSQGARAGTLNVDGASPR